MLVGAGGWNDAVAGGWNGGERVVNGIRRIPLQGLTLVNQDAARDPATGESAAGRAILCVPEALDPAHPVDVLFHLHGRNIGYRQRTDPKLPDAGTVRDVKVDEIEDQLGSSGRGMIAVLPQGALAPTFGLSGATGFDCNMVLSEVLAVAVTAGVWPTAPAVARVALSGHGGGGSTISSLVGQPGRPRLPGAMAALFLFAAINSSSELAGVTGYVTDRLDYDLLNIQSLDPSEPDQLSYLQKSLRLVGLYNPKDTAYATSYATLKQSLVAWFGRHTDDLGGTNAPVYGALCANYQIIESTTSLASDGIVGSGNLRQALSSLAI